MGQVSYLRVMGKSMARLDLYRKTLAVLLMFVGITPAAEQAEAAMRATVRISQGNTSGTGWLVALEAPPDAPPDAPRKHLLVTAAHVFSNMDSGECTLHFRTADQERGFVRKEVKLTIRDGQRKLWTQHPEMDAAVIAIDLPEGVDCQPFPERRIADEKFAEAKKVRVGQDVCVACFPAKVEANAAGWPILRKGSIATYPLLPLAEAKTIFIDYSHFGGDSGAPVVAWVDDEPLVVGLVIAMQRQTDKTSSPFEERTLHTPLHLAIAVQAPLIRQTIELWRKR